MRLAYDHSAAMSQLWTLASHLNPAVTNPTKDNYDLIFGNPGKKQVILSRESVTYGDIYDLDHCTTVDPKGKLHLLSFTNGSDIEKSVVLETTVTYVVDETAITICRRMVQEGYGILSRAPKKFDIRFRKYLPGKQELSCAMATLMVEAKYGEGTGADVQLRLPTIGLATTYVSSERNAYWMLRPSHAPTSKIGKIVDSKHFNTLSGTIEERGENNSFHDENGCLRSANNRHIFRP